MDMSKVTNPLKYFGVICSHGATKAYIYSVLITRTRLKRDDNTPCYAISCRWVGTNGCCCSLKVIWPETHVSTLDTEYLSSMCIVCPKRVSSLFRISHPGKKQEAVRRDDEENSTVRVKEKKNRGGGE